MTKKQRKIIATTVCRQVAYDRDFKRVLASSQLPAWFQKNNQTIQGDSLFDQDFNRLSNEYFGSIKYTDNTQLTYYTYIRDIFQYVQKGNGTQTMFAEHTNIINQKCSIVEEYRPTLKLHRL